MSCIIKNGKYFDSKNNESKLYKDLAEKVGEQEAHSLFVLSHTDTFKKEIEGKTKEAVKDLIPKGANFKETIVNGIRTFHISMNGNKVGRIQLKKYKEGFKVKSALVNEDMKGKGFGKALYAYSIYRLSNEGATLYTDTFRTEDADKVWERLQKQELTEDGKTIPPINSIFTPNGEPKAEVVLKYSQDNFSLVEPLTQEEIFDLATLQIKDVENSDDLYDVLYDAFYKNGIFEPQLKKMQKIYTEEEIRTILEDVEIQARIKETVEKLRHTEEFNIAQIEYDKDFSYKDLVINIIGQYKSNNPLQDRQIYNQENIEEGFIEIEVIDEQGKPIQEKLIYENAVKIVKDPKIIDAIQAVVDAPQVVDTSKVENKVQRWLLDYGLDIKSLAREKYQTLLNFIKTPNDENTILALEQSLGFERSPRKEFIKITPENRIYQKLNTTKTEQELFDELSLIKTNTPNVYQKVNKIDEQEMRDIQENQDLIIPEYQLYKDYYEYNKVNEQINNTVNTNIESNIDYLTNEFVADFAAEKLKKPNNEFYQQFKINENGIELVSNDEITLAKIKSQIKYYPKLADYSLVSKMLPNLKDATKTTETKEDRRIQAVNNKQNIPTPKTEIEIIDEQFIKAPNETSEWLKIGSDVYEQIEEGVYSKLDFTEEANYYTFKVDAPPYRTFEQKEIKIAEKTIKKLTNKKTDSENFDCL